MTGNVSSYLDQYKEFLNSGDTESSEGGIILGYLDQEVDEVREGVLKEVENLLGDTAFSEHRETILSDLLEYRIDTCFYFFVESRQRQINSIEDFDVGIFERNFEELHDFVDKYSLKCSIESDNKYKLMCFLRRIFLGEEVEMEEFKEINLYVLEEMEPVLMFFLKFISLKNKDL